VPTFVPTEVPTESPTKTPTIAPTFMPTVAPTKTTTHKCPASTAAIGDFALLTYQGNINPASTVFIDGDVGRKIPSSSTVGGWMAMSTVITFVWMA
jgi:hypothetical protein